MYVFNFLCVSFVWVVYIYIYICIKYPIRVVRLGGIRMVHICARVGISISVGDRRRNGRNPFVVIVRLNRARHAPSLHAPRSSTPFGIEEKITELKKI